MDVTITIKSKINLSIKDAFLKKYRIFNKYLETEIGKHLYDIVVTEEILYLACYLSDELGLPAITAAAERCSRSLKSRGTVISDTDRQFLGALFCAFLEANGYRKKKKANGEDLKKPVPHPDFRSAQVYERAI